MHILLLDFISATRKRQQREELSDTQSGNGKIIAMAS